MMIKRKLKNFSRLLPYYIPKGAPINLQKIWFQKLWNGRINFIILYYFSISFWKFYFFLKIYFSKKIYGRKVDNQQKKQLIQLALVQNIHPKYFYFFKLYKQRNWKQKDKYLYHRSLLQCFSYVGIEKELDIINNKFLFYKFCLDKEFPSPKNYAWCNQKDITVLDIKPWTNYLDFIIKPFKGSVAKGFEKFTYSEEKSAYYTAIEQRYIPISMVEDYILFLSREHKENLLIQESLKNHKLLHPFGNESLTTIRVISIIDNKTGEIKIVRPIIKFPQGKEVLNYAHNGALLMTIDSDTGYLDSPLEIASKYYAHEEIGKNKKLEKIKVPCWEQLLTLVKKLHLQLSKIPLIGWDIAITQDGPIFLEGNQAPWLDIHQKPPFPPFIDSEFHQLFLEHLSNIKHQSS